jgi:hypothetical protein
MSDKAFNNSLSEVFAALARHEAILKETHADIKINKELLTSIHERLSDMSVKVDFFGNMNGGVNKKPKAIPAKKLETSSTKKPSKKPTDTTSTITETKTNKIINNIMTYFKTRYTEDQNYFDDIYEENQIKAILLEHKDLEYKKGINKIKAQAGILYKKLTDSQRKKVRDRKDDENEAASVNNADDIEAEKSEAEKSEAEKSDEESS